MFETNGGLEKKEGSRRRGREGVERLEIRDRGRVARGYWREGLMDGSLCGAHDVHDFLDTFCCV